MSSGCPSRWGAPRTLVTGPASDGNGHVSTRVLSFRQCAALSGHPSRVCVARLRLHETALQAGVRAITPSSLTQRMASGLTLLVHKPRPAHTRHTHRDWRRRRRRPAGAAAGCWCAARRRRAPSPPAARGTRSRPATARATHWRQHTLTQLH